MKGFKDKLLKATIDASEKISEFNFNSSFDVKDYLKIASVKTLSFGDFVHRNVPEILSNESFYRGVVSQLNESFHHHKENPAIKTVIDGLAHTKEAGGPLWHRIADGRHTFSGAMDALSEEFPDMPYFDRAMGTFQHLAADINSISGLPLWQFESIEQFTEFCKSVGLPKSVVADFITVNSAELLTSALTIVPSLYSFNEMQAQDFARLAGRLGILTIGGSQFEALSSVVTLFALGQSIFLASREEQALSSILVDLGIEGGFTTLVVASTAFLPFPISLAAPMLITGFKHNVYENGFESAFADYKEAILNLKESISEVDISDNLSSIGELITKLKSA